MACTFPWEDSTLPAKLYPLSPSNLEKDPMTNRRRHSLRLLCLVTMSALPAIAHPPAAAFAVERAEVQKVPSLQIQPWDDIIVPLQPRTPRTVSDKARVEALAWYGTGRLLEDRNDFAGAYSAYQKAEQLDPDSIKILHSLIPLAFSLNHTEDGLKYALRAVQLNPNDYQLLRRLGTHLRNTGDTEGALRLFEQAAKAPDLKKESALYVTLMRDLGVLYRATDRKAEAADCFEVVFDALQNHQKYKLDRRTRRELEVDPELDYELLGQSFLDAERPQLALKAFQLAAEGRRGKAGNLSYNLAQVYLQTSEAEKALAELQKYLDAQRQSKGRAAYELLGRILEKLGKQDEIISRLEELASKDPRNSTLQYYLADQYAAAGKLEEAEKLYQETLQADAELVGYLGLASVYRQQKKAPELLQALAKGMVRGKGLEAIEPALEKIAQDPELLTALFEAGRKQAQSDPPTLDFESSYLLAKLAVEGKQDKAAEEFYRIALTRDKTKAAAIYEELGQHLISMKRYLDAAKVFQEAADNPALSQNRPSFLFLLSHACEMGGETKQALEAIEAARQVVPNNPLLQYQEAWIYSHSGQYDKAIERFEKLIATYPESTSIVRRSQFSLSNIYVQQGNMEKGEAILEEVLKEDPNDPSVNNDLGYLWADQGKNLEQAEQMIRKALKAEPENVAYLDSMGWVLFKRGKAEEALTYLEKAVASADGADATIWDHLGDVYEKLDQLSKAVEAWEKALAEARSSAKPDEELIQKIQEKLKKHAASAGKAPAAGS